VKSTRLPKDYQEILKQADKSEKKVAALLVKAFKKMQDRVAISDLGVRLSKGKGPATDYAASKAIERELQPLADAMVALILNQGQKLARRQIRREQNR
jgi:hypothetical protein